MNALERYYGTLDYDAGTLAYKRGGQMGFGRRYDFGSWFKKVNTTNKDGSQKQFTDPLYGSQSEGSSGWEALTKGGAGGGWGGAITTGLGIVSEGISSYKDFRDKETQDQRYIDQYGEGHFDNIFDNTNLLQVASTLGSVGFLEEEDLRDKSLTEDFLGALGKGVSTGMSTNPYVGAAIGLADFGKSLWQRGQARDIAARSRERAAKRNVELAKRLYQASANVDEANDAARMMSYYNDAFEYGYGGEMSTHGADFNNGFTYINAGGTHEQNPLEGVPSGVDEQGVPNLVEEGEVIWNNEYVFSNRIKIPKALAEKYKLSDKLTFAEAIKEATKEALTRPNDPISNETNKAIVNEFMDEQEVLREKEQRIAARNLQRAQDEDFMEQLAAAQTQPMMPQAPVNLPAQPQAPVEGMPTGFAMGGNKFEKGSWKNYVKESKDDDGQTIYVTSDGQRFYSEKGAQKYIELNQERLISNIPDFEPSPYAIVTASYPEPNVPDGIKVVYNKALPGRKGAVHHYETSDGLNMGTNLDKAVAYQTRLNNTRAAAERAAATAPTFDEINIFGTTPYGEFNPFLDVQGSTPLGFTFQPEEPAAPVVDEAGNVIPPQGGTNPNPAAAPAAGTGRTGGKTGAGTGTGKKSNPNDASQLEAEATYKNFVDSMDKASDENKKRFIEEINKTLPAGKKVKDYADWKKKATDGVGGPVHDATNQFATKQRTPVQGVGTGSTLETHLEVGPDGKTRVVAGPAQLGAAAVQSKETLPGVSSYFKSTSTVGSTGNKTKQKGAYSMQTPWERYAPIVGSGLMAANSIINGPRYDNADAIIEAARAAGAPVNIPVQTIGDYMTFNPYDERYLVNMANQNRAAATRGIVNTSGGNRAMDLLGNMSLAHSNQTNLGEIMRQAYLANQAERAKVSEFSRSTNIQNMGAINQRNLAQAQLNSNRQATALNGLARGYGMREDIWRDWRNDRDANIETFLDNLGSRGREKMTDNQALSFASEMGYNWTYDPNTGQITFVKPTTAKGGYKKSKKRRF